MMPPQQEPQEEPPDSPPPSPATSEQFKTSAGAPRLQPGDVGYGRIYMFDAPPTPEPPLPETFREKKKEPPRRDRVADPGGKRRRGLPIGPFLAAPYRYLRGRWIEADNRGVLPRRLRALGKAAVVVVVAGAGVALIAKWQIGSYRALTVVGMVGDPQLISPDGRPAPLHVGDPIRVSEGMGGENTVSTDAHSRVMLDSRGLRLHILENTALAISGLDYRRRAPARQLTLRHGGVAASAEPTPRGQADLALTAGSARIRMTGAGEFIALSGYDLGVPGGAPAGAIVAAYSGAVRVSGQGGALAAERTVPKGQEVSLWPGQAVVPNPVPFSAPVRRVFHRSIDSIAAVPPPNGALRLLANLSEKAVMPVAEAAQSVVRTGKTGP